MNKFKLWFSGIKLRLLLVSFVPLLGFGLISYFGYEGVSRIESLLSDTMNTIVPSFRAIGEMKNSINKFDSKIFAAISHKESLQKQDEDIKEAELAVSELKHSIEMFKQTLKTKEDKDQFDQKVVLLENMKKLQGDIISLVKQKNKESEDKALSLINGEYEKASAEVKAWNQEVNDYLEIMAEEGKSVAVKTTADALKKMLMFAIIVSVFIISVLLVIAHKLSYKLMDISEKLKDSSDQVYITIEQLNESGNLLAQSSTQSAANLEETVSSLEELTSIVKNNNDRARIATNLAKTSTETAENGEKEMKSLIALMKKISDSSKRIEEITDVIDDIAFQTNLLALNAAVEAARAGEQGKGFAVVADAVRTLSQKSSLAAKDISNLIKEAVELVSSGSVSADRCGEALSTIVKSTKEVASINYEISESSNEQTGGISQISTSMNQLDQQVQRNASTAEEIAATSTEINTMIDIVHKLTNDLNKEVLGKNNKNGDV